jgi:phage baseplate assembly protein W
VRSAVSEALTRLEPRIDVQDVRVYADDDGEGVLTIHVRYRIRRTNTEENLVYPFYIRGGGGA